MINKYFESFEDGIAPSVLELREAHEVVQQYLETRLPGGGGQGRGGAFVQEALGTLELVLFQIETYLPSDAEVKSDLFWGHLWGHLAARGGRDTYLV